MASADVQPPVAEPKPKLPDYLTDPNAVLGDTEANWRYGTPPDYSKTRKVYEESEYAGAPLTPYNFALQFQFIQTLLAYSTSITGQERTIVTPMPSSSS